MRREKNEERNKELRGDVCDLYFLALTHLLTHILTYSLTIFTLTFEQNIEWNARNSRCDVGEKSLKIA
jgi:hypothetical protein